MNPVAIKVAQKLHKITDPSEIEKRIRAFYADKLQRVLDIENVKSPMNVSYDLTMPGHNYLGPGTKLVTNLVSGNLPTDYNDLVAMQHDYQYVMAADLSDIQMADSEFIKDTAGFEGMLTATAMAGKVLMNEANALIGAGQPDFFSKLTKQEIQYISELYDIRLKQAERSLGEVLKHSHN